MLLYAVIIMTLELLLVGVILFLSMSGNNKIENVSDKVNVMMTTSSNDNNNMNELVRNVHMKVSNQILGIVTIALYKMYSNLEILDFESLSENLHKNISDLIKDPETLKEWDHKLYEYMKSNNSDE